MHRIVTALIGIVLGAAVGFLLLFFLPLLPLSPDSTAYKTLGIKKLEVMGFAPYWLLDRSTQEYSDMVTNYAYFGLTIDGTGKIVKLVNPQEEEPGWTHLRSQRVADRLSSAREQQLTTTLVLHNANERDIASLLSNPQEHAQNLISDVLPIINEYEFSEINIDIESFLVASPGAQLAFTEFVNTVVKGVKAENDTTVSIDVSPTALVLDFITDVEELGKIVDRVMLMTYDYHYTGSPISGPVAPIGGAGFEREFDVETGIIEAVKVVPPEKLLLGIPLYGYEWETLSDRPQSATIPGGASVASAARIEELLHECTDCTTGRGELSGQPYVIISRPNDDYSHQIFYEDEDSIRMKLALAKKYGLAGVALWALGYESSTLLDPLR